MADGMAFHSNSQFKLLLLLISCVVQESPRVPLLALCISIIGIRDASTSIYITAPSFPVSSFYALLISISNPIHISTGYGRNYP